MNVIFMGTPEFAVPALKYILESNDHKVVAVFSQKPKAQGRGMKIIESPVHRLARSYNIPVYTPSNLKNQEVVNLIKSIEADIVIVAAYGFVIPQTLLEEKKYGCLNIHPSSLPKYRGPAPIQWTIINRETKTAVCIIKMDKGIDTGDIMIKQEITISNRITFRELHDMTSRIGASILMKLLNKIDQITPSKQSGVGISYAYKLSKKESRINWHEPAYLIDSKIRALDPWPGSYFEYEEKKIKIIEAEYFMIEHKENPGKVINFYNKVCEIACGKGILRLIKLRPESKKVMNAKDYLIRFNDKNKNIYLY